MFSTLDGLHKYRTHQLRIFAANHEVHLRIIDGISTCFYSVYLLLDMYSKRTRALMPTRWIAQCNVRYCYARYSYLFLRDSSVRQTYGTALAAFFVMTLWIRSEQIMS